MAFPHFGSLPPEIRAIVWSYALPDARVYEIMDVPGARQRMAPATGLMFANVHDEPPPALSAVCRESRAFTLDRYQPLTLGHTTKYVDLSRDLLLLEPYLLLRRLQRAMHFMARVPLIRNRLEVLALGTSYGIHTGICHPVLSWRGGGGGGGGGAGGGGGGSSNGGGGGGGNMSASAVSSSAMARLLAGLAQFPKLETVVFVVHQEFQFGFTPTAPTTALTPAVSLSSVNSSPLPAHGFSSLLLQSLAPTFHPQIVHQAYRFKFDVEANINQHPRRRPHVNEMLFYPLEEPISAGADTDRDDWEVLLGEAAASMAGHGANGGSGGAGSGGLVPDFADDGDWCDPWPTNDDWRRFKRSFQRAVVSTLQRSGALRSSAAARDERQRQRPCVRLNKSESHGVHGGASSRRTGATPIQARIGQKLPAIQGASILWRYLGE